MANIKTTESAFQDLGKFKSLERKTILNRTVFILKFQYGEMVLNDMDKQKLTKQLILLN